MKFRVGITGASGFIGSSLTKHLSQDFEVVALDIRPPKQELMGITEYRACDIRKYDEVKKALRDVDIVIHTAIVQIPLINEQKRLGYEVNVVGTQNVCNIVNDSSKIMGMILTGTWHTIGESRLMGVIDETFGYRPDKVEERAKLYALSKIAQESIVRFFDEMSEKIYGIIRMGTVLGEGMPEKAAANIFINNGLCGKPITPFRHSMYRPMFYVDITDVCIVYERFVKKILNGEVKKEGNSLAHIFNLCYPEPITILELAEIVRDTIIRQSNGTIKPKIEIADIRQPVLFSKEDKAKVKIDVSKALSFFQLERLKSPRESIEEIVRVRLATLGS